MKLTPAILLTGATGLLGRYILRRLLQAGHDVAVVVRPGNALAASAIVAAGRISQADANTQLVRQRVEEVLQPFELHQLLPRPRVITWDFSESSPSNSRPSICVEDLRWLKNRDLVVIHCAASIRFQQDAVSGEPYRTNVSGLQNLLGLCRELKVSAFHHVSTAYVGQHRSSDTVLEVPVVSAEIGGNDYEQSKILAEQLVMQCSHIGRRTIHRPSIVIGDSQTGFTSTFHGFYAPLQIGWQYARMFGFSEQAGQWFRQQLGLQADDRKNLVTVDWVSEGIVMAAERPKESTPNENFSTEILHWTNPQPVACQVMQAAIVDAIERAAGKNNSFGDVGGSAPITAEVKISPSPEQFREQMRVYETYFQSDPIFDNRQAAVISEQLVCPQVGYDLLTHLSDWAIQANFGWPKPQLPQLPNQPIVDALRHFDWPEQRVEGRIVRVQVLGPGAPETMCFLIDQNHSFQVPIDGRWDQTWRVSLSVLTDCVSGKTDLNTTFNNGYWLIEGKSAGGDLDCARNWINHIGTFLK